MRGSRWIPVQWAMCNVQCSVSLCLHADDSVQAKQAQVARTVQYLGPLALACRALIFNVSVSGRVS